MKTVTVIGGGWLGRPLAHYLDTIGHKVYVSKTTDQGVSDLSEEQLNAFRFNLDDDSSTLKAAIERQAPDIVIGCFPPGFRSGGGQRYAKHWQTLLKICQSAKVRKVVMVSSTSVYPDIATDMREEDASLALAEQHEAFSEKATIMLQAEQYLKDSGLKYGIVRCSGLTGPNRHASRFAARLKQVSDQAPANMLHLADAIGAVSFVAHLETSVVVNATTPNTVSKAEFYQAALASVNSQDVLPKVVHTPDKRILADTLVSLGYRFHHQHTLEIV